ncbi:MAG TPA: AAA family ATPase [Gaiellaceae bacterium]|nr:AAA family ATPase [Gaiellaceae bacterium]
MHLSAIKLRGFKSFPDPVEVRLEPGVAVVVGPNGSGKSNVSDGIVWAAGSLSPSELRAEKPDDVLFAGSSGRKSVDFCEVELLFDNADDDGPVDFSELSIARRLHRGGEGQYLVNRAAVRRIDLVELLADLGLGGGMHSVIGQGKVEEVLASSPEKRREMIEEAAGLGRFKRQRHRAELKLQRVSLQVERARDVEAEVKKRLRPLALQATAAERAEKLGGEIASLRARIAQLDLDALGARMAEGEERRTTAALARRHVNERLESLLVERNGVEEELTDAAGKREEATAALYRLRSAGERLTLRLESIASLRTGLPSAEETFTNGAELRRTAAESAAAASAASKAREELAERLSLARTSLAALERTLVEREGIPPAARALAEEGERIALSQLDVAPGDERAVAAALRSRASAVVAADAATALRLLERARAAGLGSLTVVTRPPEPFREARVVAKEDLLAQMERAVTREGFGYDPATGELWFAGEAAEAVLLELEARRRELSASIEELDRELLAASSRAAEAQATAAAARAALDALPSGRLDPVAAARLARIAERAMAALQGAVESSGRLESPMRARVDAGSHRAQELGESLRTLGAQEVELRREAAEASERASAVEVELARVEAEATEARRRLQDAGAEPAEGDDREALAERVERLEKRRVALGQVNPLAKQEYESEKERLEELSTQRADLETSLTELEQLRTELDETVRRRFAETYAAVEEHFHEVATTLFPGGEGRLRLVEPESEEEQPGIEVELRPAGKKVTRLSLLSGGEKALGAISFLFALFLARPCPFYLLDEVEAALDDTNIGRFVALLRRYADRAQFIVITHQKRTMEAADVLYGVTMGADGISQIVSRRLPREEAIAAGAA